MDLIGCKSQSHQLHIKSVSACGRFGKINTYPNPFTPYKSRFGERLFTQSPNAGIMLYFFEETGCGVERHIFHPFLVNISLHT